MYQCTVTARGSTPPTGWIVHIGARSALTPALRERICELSAFDLCDRSINKRYPWVSSLVLDTRSKKTVNDYMLLRNHARDAPRRWTRPTKSVYWLLSAIILRIREKNYLSVIPSLNVYRLMYRNRLHIVQYADFKRLRIRLKYKQNGLLYILKVN